MTTPKDNKAGESNQHDTLPSDDVITYVEFYAGIGGWTMALHEALSRGGWTSEGGGRLRLKRLAALDHSDLCLGVLQHNFPILDIINGKKRKRAKPVAIDRLTLADVQEWNATVWAMSPPCQPHTRQHTNQKDELNDPRSQSFLHICQLLEDMEEQSLPKLLLMENVVGFESSASCRRWREALSKRQYELAHFHLTPTQVGIPNDRPRYYCVAVRSEHLVSNEESSLRCLMNPEGNIDLAPAVQEHLLALDVRPSHQTKQETESGGLPRISEFLDAVTEGSRDGLEVPDKLLDSSAAWCFDIVTLDDRRSACFTQSYGKFIRGTGSVLYSGFLESNKDGNEKDLRSQLQLVAPHERTYDANWSEGLNLKQNLRYFSGTEVARLMGFPVAADIVDRDISFSFPKGCSIKQQWKLLGNSLNVRVAARVAELGLRLVTWKCPAGKWS